MALDCEMCSTSLSDRALLSATLVDQHGTVLLSELVQPAGTILDLRTDITGITLEQLEVRPALRVVRPLFDDRDTRGHV